MNNYYFSFLLCKHDDHTDVYVSGREIGVIRDNVFHPTQVSGKGDNPIPKTFASLGLEEFKTEAEFKDFLLTAVSAIQMGAEPK